MRLSDGELRWMQARLAQRYAAAGRDAQEKLERQLAVLAPDQALLTSWCYAASPLSDWANYDFSLFSSCAAHALHLWEQSPSVRALPEQLFLNYVLHPRVNEEELCDCRGVFYAQLAERIQGLSACEAILAINAWNAEQVCYRSTDGRTISALGAAARNPRSRSTRCEQPGFRRGRCIRPAGRTAMITTPGARRSATARGTISARASRSRNLTAAGLPVRPAARFWCTAAASEDPRQTIRLSRQTVR